MLYPYPENMSYEERDRFIQTRVALGWDRERFQTLKSYTTEKGFSLLMLAHWKNTGEIEPKQTCFKRTPRTSSKEKA